MNHGRCKVLWCFLFSQACFLKPAVCQHNETLHDYCISRLPPYQSSSRGRFSVSRIVQMCGHLDEYATCIIRERAVLPKYKQYDTALYERYFPEKYDLYRALYLYCGEYFPRNDGRVAHSDSVMMRKCEHENRSQLQACAPRVSQLRNLQQIQFALDHGETEEVKLLSCSIQAEYIQCLNGIYTRCQESFTEYFLFLQSRLGSRCLRRWDMYSKVLMHTICYHSGSTTTAQFSADVSRITVFTVWAFLGWVTFL